MTARTDVSVVPPQGGYIAKKCPVVIQNRILVPDLEADAGPEARMRMDAGIEFEAAVVQGLQADLPLTRIEAADMTEAQRLTRKAMAQAVRFISNPFLPVDGLGRRTGRPDLLVWHIDGYVPIDIKAHRTLDVGDGKVWVSEEMYPWPSSAYEEEGLVLRRNLGDALQLAHYRRMLEALGYAASSTWAGIMGKDPGVVWYDLAEPMWTTPSTSDPSRKTKKRTTLERYDFEFGFRLDVAAAALEVRDTGQGELLVEPMASGECADCGFRDHCFETLLAGTGDVSLVPGTNYQQWRRYRDLGVRERGDLAALHYPTAELVARGVDVGSFLAESAGHSPAAAISAVRPRATKQIGLLEAAGILKVGDLERLDALTAEFGTSTSDHILDARAAIGPDPVYRRPGVSGGVPRADIEIDLDMESMNEGVYLWGSLLTDRAGSGAFDEGYLPFISWGVIDSGSEHRVFVDMWEWLMAQRAKAAELGLTLGVYVWHAPAENSAARRTVRNSDGLREAVEDLISSDSWVDLQVVFDQGWLTGASTGLKAVAPLAGFGWPVDDPGGGMSMVWYLEAVHDGSAEARQWILDYNRGDVEATRAIREWLDGAGHTWPVVPTN